MRSAIAGEVRFDPATIAAYSTDASNYRQPPVGVVIPRTVDDVALAVEVCRHHEVPILNRGGGTSLAGQCCNHAVVIDTSKYLRAINWIDVGRRLASVQPGCVLDDLREATEREGLTFGPDPSTHDHCTLGGMIGNNACGVHAQMAGRTADNVHELEILTYDGLRMRVGPTSDQELDDIVSAGGRRGEIYAGLRHIRERYGDLIRERFPDIPRRVSGYTLEQLLPENGFNVARALVGSESTCVTVVEAVCNLVPSAPERVLVVLGYRDVFAAADDVPQVLTYDPIALEGIDRRLVENMEKKNLHAEDVSVLPEGDGWLMVQFGGDTREQAEERAHRLMDATKVQGSRCSVELYDDDRREQMLWDVRESGLGATARVPGDPDRWPGWEDSAVPPDRLGGYLRDLKKLFHEHGYDAAVYGHFGQGCVHCRIDFDLKTKSGIDTWKTFLDGASDLVLSYGGSLSGEHGDGQARGFLLEKMYGPELMDAFREFKAIWDPAGRMNPGKVIDADPVDAHLRLGSDYLPAQPNTHFAFGNDDGSLARATLRCVGVGKCRREGGGTMCPSYMVTREEAHSTRGRARILFEMLQGDVVNDGWKSDDVKEALDLCLACKGCKNDCPVNVDMATYKAEFMSHYYEGRLRPRTAYSIGLVHVWARIASRTPRLVNLITQGPLAPLIKRAGGVASERPIPRFAEQTFAEWFRDQPERNRGGPEVLVWPDTFTNFLEPAQGRAATEVLWATGAHVVLPEGSLCCGRPLFDYGMLKTAKSLLRRTLGTIRPHLAAGTPIVGLEPSCLAVFRDELTNLFPNDEDAIRLSQRSFTLSEYLTRFVSSSVLPGIGLPALVQGHCHHKAVMHMHAEEQVMTDLALDYEILDSGCCGLAGSFGFEAGEKYAVSIAAGERVLLPAVRAASAGTLVLADGFSCKTQIQHNTGRRALHLAEVISAGLRHRDGDIDALRDLIASTHAAPSHTDRLSSVASTVIGLGVGLAAGELAVLAAKRRRRRWSN